VQADCLRGPQTRPELGPALGESAIMYSDEVHGALRVVSRVESVSHVQSRRAAAKTRHTYQKTSHDQLDGLWLHSCGDEDTPPG
jgi:hypothetical protein